MPLSDDELGEVRRRVMRMFMDTIETFEAIEKNAGPMFGDRGEEIRKAINEYFEDFLRNPAAAGQRHPEALIYETPKQNFQQAGFYGAQLDVKERQVTQANRSLRQRLAQGALQFWRRPFRKWVDIINNFLGSLGAAAGVGEALKELKDCLRDELPDDGE
ncbi:MAG: hypothetical protein ACREVL_00725 [Solimonas sp.]